MPRTSAGVLMYRRAAGGLEVLLVHPGGPFWAKKDSESWSIPKGEYDPALENPLDVARREFEEETGIVPSGEFLELGAIKQPSGKVITVWAFEGDCDPDAIRSNTFTIEWPPKSGKQQEFPEVDRAGWFDLAAAAGKIHPGQLGFLQKLVEVVNG